MGIYYKGTSFMRLYIWPVTTINKPLNSENKGMISFMILSRSDLVFEEAFLLCLGLSQQTLHLL